MSNEFENEPGTPLEPQFPPPKKRRRKGNSARNGQSSEPETTFDRAASLPDETQAPPAPTQSQETDDFDEQLNAALAPDDEAIDLDAELGPPRFTTVPRRTSPPRMIPFRIFPRDENTKTLFMLTVAREAQDETDVDTYVLPQAVRLQFAAHPVFRKQIRRFSIRLGVTSLGKPFFLEVNLEDHGIWGQSRRDLVARAEMEWVQATSDRQSGYTYHSADHSSDLVMPEQGYGELFSITYRSCLINGVDHPIIQRGALRKARK
jgi:hypothetical protein